jgi:hypothetical protein
MTGSVLQVLADNLTISDMAIEKGASWHAWSDVYLDPDTYPNPQRFKGNPLGT